MSIHFLCHSYEYILFQQIWHYHETKRVMWENEKKQNRLMRIQLFCMHYFVKYTQWNWFYTASTENPLINPFIHWRKTFRWKKCFLDYADSSSIGSHNKFVSAATAKTSPGNLLCYLLRTCSVSGWVSVLSHFLKNIPKNQKPWKSTRAKLIECYCQLNVKKKHHPTKIFYEIIVSKLRENRCKWFAFLNF